MRSESRCAFDRTYDRTFGGTFDRTLTVVAWSRDRRPGRRMRRSSQDDIYPHPGAVRR